jgi:gamma-glutamyltranspeptidase/glutathione hydrolase
MSENYSRTFTITKPVVRSPRGVVAAQNQVAADVGAGVLAKGGNAVDAAIATAYALAAVEPWMSGAGGGGYMVVHMAKAKKTQVVDFGMIAARGLDPKTYPLAEGRAGDLFGWPAVVEDRNIKGYHAIAVPGQVAGMELAHKTFATWKWEKLLEPAIGLAERGINVDWYTTLMIAGAARDLVQFPTSKAVFMPDGFAPVLDWAGTEIRVRNKALPGTLQRLAKAGPRDFYEGELARAIVADLQKGGSPIAPEDFAAYRARLVEPLALDYGAARIHAAPGLTAGPTLARTLGMLKGKIAGGKSPSPASFAAFAEALIAAYQERLTTMGDRETPSCTTHFCVVDGEGNMVALTQTLLSLFGSRVVLPDTGVLMNNGIMWFDPRPGVPNAMAPGKRPLSNMCPIVATRDGNPWFALGASGGRRIMPAVAQIASFLIDHGLDLERAFHHPRIDVPGAEPVSVDARMPAEIRDGLAARFETREVVRSVSPMFFACPTAVLREADGFAGAAEITQPWAAASGA